MQERRLATIMSARRSHCEGGFTDIVGYTALMGSDEDRSFQLPDKGLGNTGCILAEKKKSFWSLIRRISDQAKVDQIKNIGAEFVVDDLKDITSL